MVSNTFSKGIQKCILIYSHGITSNVLLFFLMSFKLAVDTMHERVKDNKIVINCAGP